MVWTVRMDERSIWWWIMLIGHKHCMMMPFYSSLLIWIRLMNTKNDCMVLSSTCIIAEWSSLRVFFFAKNWISILGTLNRWAIRKSDNRILRGKLFSTESTRKRLLVSALRDRGLFHSSARATITIFYRCHHTQKQKTSEVKPRASSHEE